MKTLFFLLLFLQGTHATLAFNQERPNLLVVLVVDQLRADQLINWEKDFTKTGFNRIRTEGAYAPFAEYPVLQNMTCPGHAMISTGSSPSANKIPLNEWYSESEKKIIPCSFDAKFEKSPKNLSGSTIGDQIRLRYPNSKIVSVALKDRSAIMLGGHSATASYWFDQRKNQWVTSDYYTNALSTLKSWVHPDTPKIGEKIIFSPLLLRGDATFKSEFEWGSPKSLAHPIALKQTFDFSKELLKKYKLGQRAELDVLLLSLSNHDIAGHAFGPDALESKEIMMLEDREISALFAFLKTHVIGGEKKTWLALTADHGVAPTVEVAKSIGLSAGRIDLKGKIADWNRDLKYRFHYCSDPWIVGTKSFHLYLNQACLNKNSVKANMLIAQMISRLRSVEGIETAALCDQVRVTPHVLPPEIEKRLKLSCVPGVSGQIIAIPKPFWYEQGPPATHMTHYSYDRTVPVVFWGQPFKAGVIQADVSVLDFSSTLLYALGILPTAQAEGKVLYEVFKSKPIPK